MSSEPENATPLELDELSGLIPSLTTRGELNTWETANILKARTWALKSRKVKKELLSTEILNLIHQKMFDDTWEWAGQFRKSDKNIGVSWFSITTELFKLCKDTEAWLANDVYPMPELVARFHHKLVWIHPYPNGNGRHARLVADLLLINHKQQPFSWGASIKSSGEARIQYIKALKAADSAQFSHLIQFCQS